MTNLWLLARDRHSLISAVHPIDCPPPPKSANHLRDPQRVMLLAFVLTLDLWVWFDLLGERHHRKSLLVEMTARTMAVLGCTVVVVLLGWGSRMTFRWGNSGIRDTTHPERALVKWVVAWLVHLLALALLLAAITAEGNCIEDHTRNVRLMHALWGGLLMWLLVEPALLLALVSLPFCACCGAFRHHGRRHHSDQRGGGLQLQPRDPLESVEAMFHNLP